MSRLVVIKLMQEWHFTAWRPRDLHAWDQFITPEELRAALSRHQLRGRGIVGLGPGVKPIRLIHLVWQLRHGHISHGEFGRRARFVVTRNLRVSYAGYATKAA